tara:strand:+ start:362 stop:628 length:267 start_codon:yes stop_codon:yes gene_type:complete
LKYNKKIKFARYAGWDANMWAAHFARILAHMFTPLIVVPKNSKFSTPELQQQITNTLGSIPIVKRGNFKNHKYSGEHIGVYLRGNNAT